MLVSLTTTPMMCALLLRRRASGGRHGRVHRASEGAFVVVLHGYDRAREIIVTNREPVRLLAEQLLVQESLEASEIRVLLAQAGARTESGQAVSA